MCVVGIQLENEFVHILLLWRGSFLWSSATAGEHTRGADRSAWVTSGSLPLLERLADLSSVQNYRLYIVFSSPMRIYEYPLCQLILLFMAGYRNLHTSVFFSGNLLVLSANWNICHSIYRQWIIFSPSCFVFLFPVKTTLLMLSCDRFESAKFIVTS